MSTELFQNDYARMFYPKARGYTPIIPDGDQGNDSRAFFVEGVQIGDLIYRDHTGPLVYAGINITKGADDPRNWQSLPKDYEPCSLELGVDYTVHPSHYPALAAGFAISSITPAQPDGIDRYKFSTNAAQGSYCALPFGGSSYECTASGVAKLRRFAMIHGTSWYHQTVHVDNLDIQNGDLAVVTGCEKTSYWTCGLFSSAGPNPRLTKTLSVPKVVEGIAQPVDIVESCPLESTPTSGDFWVQSGRPGAAYMLENEPACFAFRGFYISLKPSVYNDLRMPWGIRQTLWHALPKVLRPPTRSWPLLMYAAVSSRSPIRQDARVKTVVVHDNDILSVLQSDEAFLPTDAELARRMTARYVVLVDSAGRAFLRDKSDVKLSKWERFRLIHRRSFISVRREHLVDDSVYAAAPQGWRHSTL
ncbi:hypothetical protein BDZ89DRAFT_1056137 [Hymenopellis radicata]|nr:hypothetical protein BDZ89DRAFT_1056137 [Hymenopellis radicata]